ncbi:beta-1,4-galactosyltransferase 4-like [Branchiostoma lanceolatum]|uniref:beta-1,4-galactosyltransferase 4-like n=1 Tax=Branchiostoma lanceolatum TaxID=7740 RepID=UPI0034539A59
MRESRLCPLIVLQVVGTLGLLTYLHLVKTSRERNPETLQITLRDNNPYANVEFSGKLSHFEKVAVLVMPPRERDSKTLQETWRANDSYGNVGLGGKWSPSRNRSASSSEKVAILVTYRDREEHLKIFLRHMHPFLQRQGLDYTIYVIEQHGEEQGFCKGLLYNVGFTEALKDDPSYDCFIFHDVDLIPEDDRNLYTCARSPYHLSVAIDKFDYKLTYVALFGGVSALNTSHYRLLNGYSNLYCGWGAEDDDMARRLYKHVLAISRPEPDIARYKMLSHKSREPREDNTDKRYLLNTALHRAKTDGLADLQTANYSVTSITHKALYTHILVNITKRKPIKHVHPRKIGKRNTN